MKRKFLKFAFIFAIIFIVIFPIWYFAFGPSNNFKGSHFNKGENAVWLEHEWVMGPKQVSEIGLLINNFGAHRIKYVFIHTGPFDNNGLIPETRFPYASEFLKTARIYGDKIKYLAWVGQKRSKLNLADPTVRFNIVKTSKLLVEKIGFDGIHYDFEPVYEKDSDYLFLLKDTKKAIGENHIVSVALNEILPRFTRFLFKLWADTANPLTEEIYLDFAKYADQIAVMAYENGIKSPWVYRYFLKNEIIWLTRIFKDKKNLLLIGIPSYEKGTDLNGVKSFYPETENIENGLKGVIAGLNNTRSKKEPFAGVAIYLNKEMSEKEWEAYNKLWVK